MRSYTEPTHYSQTHAFPVLLVLKHFFFISPKVRNSMEAWNDFRGSEWGKVWKRAIHQLGSKILQPVISHFSCTSGIVLWSPLRGIKPGLIIIIEMLIAEVQITTVSNHQEAHTHTQQWQALIKGKSSRAAVWKSRKSDPLTVDFH